MDSDGFWSEGNLVHRFPRLSALRAFEAVFRCGGLAKAADDLSVTPSAISHQIRQLEADMNVKLVRREGRRIVLTEVGEKLNPSLREAFNLITAAIADVHEQETSAPLRVSMLQNFGVNWFLPRLSRFKKKYPEIEVEISLDAHYVDFSREPFDISIRHCAHDWPGLHTELLFQDQLMVACSPAFMSAHGPFDKPEQLLEHFLLVSDGRPDDAWEHWFRARGVVMNGGERSIHVSSSQLAIQAAANSIGFAIAGRRIMEAMMQRGALVAALPHTIPEHGSFYIVCPPDWINRPKIRRFRHWLAEEAKTEAA